MNNPQAKEAEPALALGEAEQVPPAKPIATRKSTGTAVAVAKEPTTFIALLAELARDPTVAADKMRSILEMQREIDAEEARRAFTVAYMALQAQLPVINKDGKIEIREKDASGKRTENSRIQQATPFATFNNIMRGIKKPLHDNGFTLSFATEPSPDGTRIVVKGFLDHQRGGQRVTAFPLPAEVSGSKNNVQGWGSSLSYGKRYCTIALLNIVSAALADVDTDGYFAATDGTAGDSVPDSTVTAKQAADLKKAIENCGVGETRFCSTYKIEKVEDLPAARFSEAINNCQGYAERAAAKGKG